MSRDIPACQVFLGHTELMDAMVWMAVTEMTDYRADLEPVD